MAPPSCPGANDFKALVATRLGYDPFRDGAQNHILGHVSTTGGHGLEGRLEWRDRAGAWAGDQAFPAHSDDCRDLVRAMGFALAVQIHLLATTEKTDAPSAAVPIESARPTAPTAPPAPTTAIPPVGAAPAASAQAPAPAPAPPKPAAPAVAPVPETPHTPELSEPEKSSHDGSGSVIEVGVGASVGFGFSSDPVVLGRIEGALVWPHVSLHLGGEGSLPATTRREDGAGFSQYVLLATTAGCGVLEPFRACVVGKAGAVLVQGSDIDVPASPSGAVAQTGLRLEWVQHLGAILYASARAEGLVNLAPWTVELDHLPVWSAPRFVETFGLGFGVILP